MYFCNIVPQYFLTQYLTALPSGIYALRATVHVHLQGFPFKVVTDRGHSTCMSLLCKLTDFL